MIESKSITNLIDIFGSENNKKWEKRYSIYSNLDIKKWLESKIRKFSRKGKNPANFTLTAKVNILQKYCDFNQCENPSELLKEDVDTRNSRMMKYLTTLINDGKNYGTVVNNWQGVIRGFYSSRGAPISEGIESVDSGENKDEIFFDRDLLKLFENRLHRPEYRLLMKLQATCGFRIGDILKKDLGLISGLYHIEKYKERYFIKDFKTIKFQVPINFVFFPKELEDLIKSIYNIEDLRNLDLTTILKTKKGNHIREKDYLDRLKKIGKELERTENIKTHCVRKYFDTQIEKYQDGFNWLNEHLMGHKARKLERAYNQNLRNREWYYTNWKKLENYICIDCQIIDETSEDVIKLKKENTMLYIKLDKLEKSLETYQKNIPELIKSFIDAEYVPKKGMKIKLSHKELNEKELKEIKQELDIK